MTETEEPRMRWTRQKVVTWRPNGEVDSVRYSVHRPTFSIEFHVGHVPDIEGLRAWGGGFVEVEGVGELFISDCPGGVEIHSRTRPRWCDEDQQPDHQACRVLGGPCWHDGSSLAASEFREFWHGDDESVWTMLESWARREDEERKESSDAE